MPDRCYAPDAAGPGPFVLSGAEAHHLARVRRAREGDRVEVLDGLGSVYDGVILQVARDAVTIDLGAPREGRSGAFPLTLAVAFPKGERLDWLVEKATELGVARLVPLRTRRSTVDPRSAKLDRLRRAVIEACKQSGRGTLVELSDPVDWSDFVQRSDPAQPRLLAHPGGLQRFAWPAIPPTGAVLAVGPEGGFTDEEASEAAAAGWVAVGLGATLLRIETAAIAGAALLLLDSQGPHSGAPDA